MMATVKTERSEGSKQPSEPVTTSELDEETRTDTENEADSSQTTSPKSNSTVTDGNTLSTSNQQRKPAGQKHSFKKFLNSLKWKGKKGDGAVATSRGGDIEASDFSFRQPSPTANRKRGSPSLDVHSTKISKKRSHSSVPIETIQAAMEEDVDGLPSEIRGGTPLHYYVWTDSVKKEKTDFLVSLLTTAEVEVDCLTEDGNTPLHLAVKKGDLEAVKVLVAFGASVNTTNNCGQTPLDIATIGYLQTEQRLGHPVAPGNCRGSHQLRRNSPKTQHHIVEPISMATQHNPHSDSPLLKKIIPRRPKFLDTELDGELEGWTCVDFTDAPPVAERPVATGNQTRRYNDLMDPVNIVMEDVSLREERSKSSYSTPQLKQPQFSAPAGHLDSTHNQASNVRSRDQPRPSTAVAEDENQRRSYDYILNLLHAAGGMSRQRLQDSHTKPISLSGRHVLPDLSMELQRSIRLAEYEEGSTILNLYEALEDTINSNMEELSSNGHFDQMTADKAIALALQQTEMKQYNKTLHSALSPFDGTDIGSPAKAGCRVLCLDGGAIRGLIQIEVLSQIEKVTGRKTVNLFDWIIGTSTGALIALLLTYGDKSLEEVRQIYFKMKNEVFTGGSYGFDTAALERLLKETFPPHMTLECPTTHNTKVLVATVYKKTTTPELRFFNNCFRDKYSSQEVWRVARYTTAAPMYFKEIDDYVDGGVLANNPSETGLTAIQEHYHSLGKTLSIAIVVSIGSGIYPTEELGRIDVQDFLFFSRQWLSFQDTVKSRTKNLIQLLSNALVESETVATNTKARCEGQGTPFYRFSPQLAETVATGETDNRILINMLLSTVIQTIPKMKEIHEQFLKIAEANQKERYRERRAF